MQLFLKYFFLGVKIEQIAQKTKQFLKIIPFFSKILCTFARFLMNDINEWMRLKNEKKE